LTRRAVQRLLGSETVVARVQCDVDGGSARRVHSTSTWYFNGELWDGDHEHATLLGRARRALGASA
jgi:hypothetical protein